MLPTQGGTDGWSLFPPLVAILIAVLTGRLVLGLATALLAAALISSAASVPLSSLPFAVLRQASVDFIWHPLHESFQLYILGFTASLIGMTRVVSLAGGTQGIAEFLAAHAEGARSTRIATFLLGLAIFFDDYANTLVVGTTMRPIADRFRISREKLAYIVDSTAAPVAGIALISTWIGYEVGLLNDIATDLGSGQSGYQLFLNALGARFYCWLTLFFVGLTVFLQRDFGPLLKAEQRARRSGQLLPPGSRPMMPEKESTVEPPAGVQPHWLSAVVPICLVILGVLVGLQLDAWHTTQVSQARLQYGFFSRLYFTTVFAHADSAKVMFLASLAGSLAAFVLALSQRDGDGRRLISLGKVVGIWLGGITGFRRALIILILAWAIKEACSAVKTSDYLIALLADSLNPIWLPLIVFLLAALVAFSIGTSWTTMALLLPTTVPLAFNMGGLGLGIFVIAAVLDGAIFGDHCSPISDTTVLSSIASSCDHLAHVKTQLPYALCTMTVAALLGYLGGPLFYGPGVGLLLGAAVLTVVLWTLGRNPDIE